MNFADNYYIKKYLFNQVDLNTKTDLFFCLSTCNRLHLL